MNYQFSRGPFDQPQAIFEMGAEAFGKWFSDELGDNQQKISSLFSIIEQLESKQIKEHRFNGAEYGLFLDQYEVEVYSQTQDSLPDDDLPEGTEVYDQETRAGCGLEDFKHVLISWREFI
ncbi:YacL family protein [Aliiglaciecola sp. LCG003]|uniref:UPF0231 family protein n=1 Tax=Aliiglaciecola sp. LCG003 TaxID=3053655 RepID=UPI002573A8F6|nr:YacL family protein [Aliiglaciecola sp. LCG003]WJG10687.1 YacL family protein [Aliiglaciecola sp. LCG003]